MNSSLSLMVLGSSGAPLMTLPNNHQWHCGLLSGFFHKAGGIGFHVSRQSQSLCVLQGDVSGRLDTTSEVWSVGDSGSASVQPGTLSHWTCGYGSIEGSPSQDEPGTEDEGLSDRGAGGEYWGAQEAGKGEEAGVTITYSCAPVPLLPILVIVAFHGGRALRSSSL